MPEEQKKKRHRLTKMVYDEISFVDRGANQHANVVIVKREAPEPTSKPRERKAGWYAADRAPTESGSGKGKKSQRSMNWKEDKHPRKASGSPAGGEFDKTSAESKKKYGKGGTTKAKQDAAKKGAESYTVKKGDTLWALAEKYYGDGTQWKKIAKANGIKDPKKLPIGKKLTIPGVAEKKEAKKATARRKKLAGSAGSSGSSAGQRLVMEPGGKVHWEKIKADRKATAKKRTAKRVAVKKRVTGVERLAAQVMFDEYTGRG